MNDIEALVAPMKYRIAQEEKKAAYERYNYASASLELAHIKERFAEIYSQWEPVNAIAELDMNERDRLCASAYYVVTGRVPEGKKKP